MADFLVIYKGAGIAPASIALNGNTSTVFQGDGTFGPRAAVWGGLTGTLADQADLQAVLNTISSQAVYATSTHNISSSAHSFPGGTTVYLRGDGVFATPAGGASPISTVKLSTIRFTTTTSSLPLTEINFSVSSGLAYKFDFGLVYASAISSTGLRVGLQYPAVSSMAATVAIPAVVATGTDSVTQGQIIVNGSSVVAPSTPLASTQYMATVRGSIVPSANGTLQLCYATEVAGSAISTFAGTYGTLTTL